MKKFIALGFLSLGIVFLAGCGQQQNNQISVDQNQNKETVYTNSTYGFSLVFPENWGVITEKVSTSADDTTGDSKIHASIILESTNKGRFIKIQVVNNEDKNASAVINYPQKYITENSTYSYYYTGAGCCEGYPGTEKSDLDIQTEVEAIIKTFTLEAPTEPLSYSTTGVDVSLVKTSVAFDLPAKQLKDAAGECGSKHADDYFDQLVLKFGGTEITHYNFTYKGESQKSDTYRVTLIPNKPGYASLVEFKKDFDICYAGGTYPTMLNKDWLLFENSCGSGMDDGSGKPVGCQKIKDVVEPTLKLNSANIISYEKFTADDIGLSFDIPTGVKVNDNLNGFPNSYKFIYNNDSYMVFYGGFKDNVVNYDKWAGKTDVTITENTNSKIYTVDNLTNTEVYLLNHDPIVTIEVVKQEGTSLTGEISSSDDTVYQHLVSSVMFEGVVAF